MTILDEIVAYKEQTITSNKRPRLSEQLLKTQVPFIIGEIKRASPSKGVFAPDLEVETHMAYYETLKVDAYSVLTDEKFFLGSFSDLEKLAAGTDKPILCKDFIIDESQIAKAFIYGASIILLIASIHDYKRLKQLIDFAHALNLEVLMEIREMDEIDKVKHLDFDMIGINNRNLKTFETQSNYGQELIKAVQAAGIKQAIISESGFSTRRQVIAAFQKGFKGVLMGEALVKGIYRPEKIIKICGLKRIEEIDEVSRRGGSHVGFVLAKSQRQISLAKCQELVTYTKQETDLKTVLVLKKAKTSELNQLYHTLKPDFIQIHADPIEDVLLDKTVRLIRGFHSGEMIDENNYDLLIMDGKLPGKGETYDWSLIDQAVKQYSKPLIVAGGLNPDNVKALLDYHDCDGVDVSSGVESNQEKDLNKIRIFIDRVKECK